MIKLIEIEVDEFEEGNICYECEMAGCEGYPHGENRCYVKRWIDEQPTVDAVPVVRCKDCKHHYVNRDGNVAFNECDLNHNRVQADDWFCADGKRKDGAQNVH